MNTLDLAQQRVKLKKASNVAGGEWQGPCPGCGGTDRFHVWPSQGDGKGAYWCRGCGKWGDNIQFLRDFQGLSFKEACARLHIDAPEASASRGTPAPRREKPEFVPAKPSAPDDLWRIRAEKFVTWAAENLAKNADQLAWLASRGISAETAARYRLGWNPGEGGKDLYRPRSIWGLPEQLREDRRQKALCIPRGLVIPCGADGGIVRIRIRRPEEHRTKEWPTPYHFLPGSSSATMVLEPKRLAFVVVESELDGIAVAAGNSFAGAVALGTASAKPDAEAFAILKEAVQILNALDYDAAGAKAVAWWAENFRNQTRWPAVKGKDPGEAIKLGMDLKEWIWAGLPPALTIPGPETRTIIQPSPRHGDPEVRNAEPDIIHNVPSEISGPVLELFQILRKNPGVKIINTENRFTVLRDGKYVGGRINALVFRTPVVTEYILSHPADEIDGENFLISVKGEDAC